MLATFSNLPPSLIPSFVTTKPNQRLKLWRGRARLTINKKSSTGRSSLYFDWLPKPRTKFTFHHNVPFFETGTGTLEIGSERLRVLVTDSGASPTGRLTSSGVIPAGRRVFSHARVQKLRFVLANFVEYRGTWVERQEGQRVFRRAGRHEFNNAGWHVILDSIIEADRGLRECLRVEGGYGLTHVGEVERSGGGAISRNDVISVLERLGYLLTFVNGAWCMPLLVQGLDRNGVPAWQELGLPLVASWRPRETWVHQDAFDLFDLFAGIVASAQNAMWKEPYVFALHWYIDSNSESRNIETSLLLAQIALELLAWTLFVEELKTHSETEFRNPRKWSAAQKIRLLLQHYGLRTSIPASLSALKRAARANNWGDGPEVLTKVRNIVAHGSRKLSTTGLRVRKEVRSLALWYLELCLLKLFGYRGR